MVSWGSIVGRNPNTTWFTRLPACQCQDPLTFGSCVYCRTWWFCWRKVLCILTWWRLNLEQGLLAAFCGVKCFQILLLWGCYGQRVGLTLCFPMWFLPFCLPRIWCLLLSLWYPGLLSKTVDFSSGMNFFLPLRSRDNSPFFAPIFSWFTWSGPESSPGTSADPVLHGHQRFSLDLPMELSFSSINRGSPKTWLTFEVFDLPLRIPFSVLCFS